MVSSFLLCDGLWVTENGMGADMRHKFYFLIQQITWVVFLFLTLFAVKTFERALPDEIYVPFGEKADYQFWRSGERDVKGRQRGSVLPLKRAGGCRGGDPFYTVTCKLFGIFPVKDVKVMMVDRQEVTAGGEAIGIYVKTDGILVLGTAKIADAWGNECSPAQNLVQSGDYIVSVNGETVCGKEELMDKIDSYGSGREIIGVMRKGEYVEVSMNPVKGETGKYRLGIWVRDDLAGVGTLTYYRQDGSFGALGHAVSDGDTGVQMSLSEGYIYETKIVSIQKGKNGVPGELAGIIDYGKSHCMGSITENSPLGIRGMLNDTAGELEGEVYEVAYKQDIVLGKAYIISEVSGERAEYEIEIESLDYSGDEENKGILFKVTDERLLDLTGGIVQDERKSDYPERKDDRGGDACVCVGCVDGVRNLY